MFLTTTLVNVPEATSFFSSVSDWSSPVFDSILPVAYVIIGIIIGVAVIWILVDVVAWAFHHRKG